MRGYAFLPLVFTKLFVKMLITRKEGYLIMWLIEGLLILVLLCVIVVGSAAASLSLDKHRSFGKMSSFNPRDKDPFRFMFEEHGD